MRTARGQRTGNVTGDVYALAPSARLPVTDSEEFLAALLAKEKRLPYEKVLLSLADSLYRRELRAGGWAADVGVFGRRLFLAEARRVVERAKGELWEVG
ncbi:MAG TPA: hypothetical protein VNN77_19625 [candidate division Zixibacteria bacterium]|nr:hypothetical protein [candidate division Zixibacteria bacterium]